MNSLVTLESSMELSVRYLEKDLMVFHFHSGDVWYTVTPPYHYITDSDFCHSTMLILLHQRCNIATLALQCPSKNEIG